MQSVWVQVEVLGFLNSFPRLGLWVQIYEQAVHKQMFQRALWKGVPPRTRQETALSLPSAPRQLCPLVPDPVLGLVKH